MKVYWIATSFPNKMRFWNIITEHWTGRPGVLWFMGSQRVVRDWGTELNYLFPWASQVALVVKNPPANTDVTDAGLILGSGRCPRGGHGNPLQYSCLENPMVRRAWQVHMVAKSQTWLKRLSTHRMSILEITFIMILTKNSMTCLIHFSHTRKLGKATLIP